MNLKELKASDRATIKVEEAAQVLGISRGSAYQAARNGELPGVLRIGHRRLVSVAALLKVLGVDDLEQLPVQGPSTEG